MGKIMNAVLLSSLGLAAGTAGAVDSSGFYAGFGAGVAVADVDQGELDSTVLDTFDGDGSSKLSDSDASLGLIVGYRFLPWLAVEAEWLTLGTTGYEALGTVTGGVPVKVTLDTDSKGVAFSALGIWPVTETWDVYGRVGTMTADTSVRGRISSDGVGDTVGDSESSQEVLFGVGATYNASAQWNVRLDCQHFQDVGDDDVTGEYSVDRLSLQWLYKF